MTEFATRTAAQIAAKGPIRLDRYMAAANAHYYAHAHPLGQDFATAPELSQVFGELVGLWAADLWVRAGRPPTTALVELGPGRGTLMADALRAAARAGFAPPVHLVETSPSLCAAQAKRVPAATVHEAIATLPAVGPLIVIANEFLDALPIRQFVRTPEGWTERHVTLADNRLAFTDLPSAETPDFPDAAPGSVHEMNAGAIATVSALAAGIAKHGGAMLLIDYGHVGPTAGDTLQAMRRGRPVRPLAHPGDADLTAHVDFAPLAAAARGASCVAHGPVPQGVFLTRLGLHARTDALARAAPSAAATLRAASLRLSEPSQMGALFKVLAIASPGWPTPAGLE